MDNIEIIRDALLHYHDHTLENVELDEDDKQKRLLEIEEALAGLSGLIEEEFID